MVSLVLGSRFTVNSTMCMRSYRLPLVSAGIVATSQRAWFWFSAKLVSRTAMERPGMFMPLSPEGLYKNAVYATNSLASSV